MDNQWIASEICKREMHLTHGKRGRPALPAQPDPETDATLACALATARAGRHCVAMLSDGRTLIFAAPALDDEEKIQ